MISPRKTSLREVIEAIQQAPFPLTHISKVSGVTINTLQSWLDGNTKRPNQSSLQVVLNVINRGPSWLSS